MALTKNFTSFGLRKLEIAPIPTSPATTPVWTQIPLAEQAEFKLDVKEQELWGDDVYQGTFYHSATGKITAKSNRTSLRIIEMVTGVNGSSTGGTQKLYFGTDAELLPPRVLVRAEMRGRDGDTGAENIDRVYWYQCEVKTPYMNLGGARAKIQEVNLEFNTFSSTQDEQGNPIDPAVGGRAFGHREAVNA